MWTTKLHLSFHQNEGGVDDIHYWVNLSFKNSPQKIQIHVAEHCLLPVSRLINHLVTHLSLNPLTSRLETAQLIYQSVHKVNKTSWTSTNLSVNL